MSAMHASTAKPRPLLAILHAVASHPLESFLLIIIDAAFFAAVLGVDTLVNTLAKALGVPSVSTAIVPILLLLAYAILLILIITIAKELHLRIARRLLGRSKHDLRVMRLFTFSAIATAALLGAYLALGRIFSGLAGSSGPQGFVFALFVAIIVFGVLVVYPSQWYLSEGMSVRRAYQRGVATFRKPLAHARVLVFFLIGEATIFILYSLSVVIFRSAVSVDAPQYADTYLAFIRASSAGFLVLSYLVFSFARLLLYEHAFALGVPPAQVSAPEAPVLQNEARPGAHRIKARRSRRKDA